MDFESLKSCVFCSCDTGLIALMETTINQIAIIMIQLGYGRMGIESQEQISEQEGSIGWRGEQEAVINHSH